LRFSRAVVAAPVLAGCAGAGRGGSADTAAAPIASGPAELGYWTWASALDQPIHQKWADAFTKEVAPRTRVALTAVTEAYLDKLVAALAAATPPDLAWSQTTQFPTLATMGVLADLSPLHQRSPSKLWSDYVKAQFDNFKWRGKQLGAAWDLGTEGLFYNQRLFQEVGVPFPTDAWTWDDYYATATRLTRGQGDEKIFGSILGSRSYYWLCPLLRSQGGEYFSDDTTKVNVTSSGFVDALERIATQHHRLHTHPLPGEIQVQGSPFVRNRVAMGFYFSFSIQGFKAEVPNGFHLDWDVVRIPKGLRCAQAVGGSGYVIPKDGKSQPVAWEALKYFSQHAVDELARAGRQLPATASQAALAVPADGVPRNYRGALIDSVPQCGRSVFYGTQYVEIDRLLSAAIQDVLTGQQAARPAMDAIAQPLQVVLDQAHQE
jgi:multiple sugar transport system substrate-binding protein